MRKWSSRNVKHESNAEQQGQFNKGPWKNVSIVNGIDIRSATMYVCILSTESNAWIGSDEKMIRAWNAAESLFRSK